MLSCCRSLSSWSVLSLETKGDQKGRPPYRQGSAWGSPRGVSNGFTVSTGAFVDEPGKRRERGPKRARKDSFSTESRDRLCFSSPVDLLHCLLCVFALAVDQTPCNQTVDVSDPRDKSTVQRQDVSEMENRQECRQSADKVQTDVQSS